MQPWKSGARSHRGVDPLNSEAGSGQEHGRGRQYFEDALSCGGKATTFLQPPERGAALCHEPGRAAKNGGESARLVENIDDSLEAIEEILGALLDISRLDAGAMTPSAQVSRSAT